MVGVVGQMSSGKSYFAVECIRRWLMQGHPVCSNIRLNCIGVTESICLPCVIWKRIYFYLTDDQNDFAYHHIYQGDYNKYPIGSPRGSSDYHSKMVYIVLDEVSSVFDSMVHASDSSVQAVAAWARHTHKRGQEVYLIMQFASELHKRLRVHVTSYISCVNTSTYKLPFFGCGLPWFLRGYSVRTLYLGDGETAVGKGKWVPFSPLVFMMYDTAQIVVGHGMGTDYSSEFAYFNTDSLVQTQKANFLQVVFILLVVESFLLLGVLLYG